MSNSIACPGCNTRYNAAPRLAGRTLTCPKCGQSIRVPPATVPPLQLAQHEQAAGEQDANVHVPQTRAGTAPERVATREEGRLAFNFWIPMIGFTGIGLLTGLAAGSLIVALLRPPRGSVAAEPVARPAAPAVVDAGGPARSPTAETLSASPEVSPKGAAVPNTPTGDAEADPASSATAWQVVELREPGSSFAFDGESGVLAAVNTESSKLHLYSDEFLRGDAKRVIGPVATGNRPSRVRFKNHNGRQLLIVAHRDEAALRLFDAETLSPVGQIDLPVSDVVSMAVSENRQDPYIYYCGDVAPAGRSAQYALHRANLATMRDEGACTMDRRGLLHFDEVVVSVHGRFVYPRYESRVHRALEAETSVGGMPRLRMASRDTSALSGSQSDKLSEAMKWIYFPVARDDREQFAALVRTDTERRERKAVTKSTIVHADFSKATVSYDFAACCFLPGGAGIAGFSGSQLCVASLDSPTVLRRDVPAGMIPDAGEHPSQASEPPPRMFSDAKRRRLVVARGNRVAMLDFDQLGIPREAPLVARFDGPPVAFLGKPYEGSLTAEAGIEVVPRELPEGMQLKEGTLSWIPSNAQVGHHRATFELRRGTESASQTITLRVDRQSLRCSFPAAYVDLSNDGRFAVVRARNHDAPRGRAPQGGTEYPVALVDVGEGRVLSERVFHYPWLQAAVDDHYVYALRPASRPIAFKLVVLSRDDLSEIQEFPVRRDDVALRTLRNQYLISEDVRTLPDLEVATSPLGTPISSVAKTGPALYRQLQQRWLVDGVVVDADGRRVELLWGFRPLDQLYFPTVRSLSCSYLSPWSMTRTMQGPAFKLVDDRGNTCKLSAPPLDDSGARTTDAYTTLFSDDSPWLVRVERDRSSGILNLLVYCPVSGEVLGQFPIGPTQGMEVAQNRSPVALAKRTVVAALGGELHVIDLQGIDDSAVTEPPRFEPRQSRFVISSKEPTRLQHRVQGGKPPYREADAYGRPLPGGFESQDGIIETELDGSDYRVSQEAVKFLDSLLQRGDDLYSKALREQNRVGPEGSDLRRETLKRYRRAIDELFAKVHTNERLQGIAVPVPVIIDAVDATGRTFSISYWVFLDVPLDESHQRRLGLTD